MFSLVANKSNGLRKSTRSKKLIQPRATVPVSNPSPIKTNKTKAKRKLRTLDGEDDDLITLGNLSQGNDTNGHVDCEKISRFIGQHGILSQSRRINDTTVTSFDDDFTIQLHSRKMNENKSKFSNDTNPIIIQSSVSLDDDVGPLNDDQMFEDVLENNDTESLFSSFDLPPEKTPESASIVNSHSILNYTDCIEDISNDEIYPPPSSSSPNIDHVSLST